MAAGLLGIVKTSITGIGQRIRIRSIGGKFTMGIQVNIMSPAFVFLTCFLALLEILKVFTFMMVIGIISLGLMDEQCHQRHHSIIKGLTSELLKRVMCCIIEGIKGEWYPLRNEHTEHRNTIRNTDIEKNKRNKQKNSKQHKLHRHRNRKTNKSIANLICKAL